MASDSIAGFLVAHGVLDPRTCDEVLTSAPPSAAGAIDEAAADAGVIRRSRVGWLTEEPLATRLRAHLLGFVEAVNPPHFDFEIDGLEPLQVARYGPGDTYGWHVDLGPAAALRRKLSFAVLLTDPTDFEGGDFEIGSDAGVPVAIPRGSAVIFPSYQRHRVAPVTSGERASLVGWFTGPPFR